MFIETQRLLIRNLQTEDEMAFVDMASDGSLIDIGFDDGCREWMAEWITEAKQFAIRNNPGMDYLAYVIALKDENISSWKVVEKAGFLLTEKKMYKDLNDTKEEMYHFYEIAR